MAALRATNFLRGRIAFDEFIHRGSNGIDKSLGKWSQNVFGSFANICFKKSMQKKAEVAIVGRFPRHCILVTQN
ncbi:MAG: hypothetical protein CMM00_06965 [Rhodopirellula sp.]|uniref:Uncharacterized protein n=1 Tax=Rhodopirellula bahusiensis TaxID=2014065 RepID=A0A2G1W7H7_9BACT|nr:hypothetical protein [Rhodopirellula sp.]PHQ34994.1 hypothetical protein CEE69_11200 [Rhodopirellula bahusiensis]